LLFYLLLCKWCANLDSQPAVLYINHYNKSVYKLFTIKRDMQRPVNDPQRRQKFDVFESK
jgi:hypothetical protein